MGWSISWRTDAHDLEYRPPLLAEGRAAAGPYVGADEAELLVTGRPQAVIEDREPAEIPPRPSTRTKITEGSIMDSRLIEGDGGP